MLYLIPPDLIEELTALANWQERDLAEYLEHNPVARQTSEARDAWRERCIENWTASGQRAIAEEETANHGATLAGRVLATAMTPAVFVEQEGGVIQDIRLDPSDGVVVVTFDWDAINESNLADAQAYLNDLVERTTELPQSAQALTAGTLAEATEAIEHRKGRA